MPHRFCLTKLAGMVRDRQISPVELVDSYLRQIEAVNPKVNAFIRVLADQAREDARQAEAAVANGESLGPLHGVPISIKDSFDMAGLPTFCGSRFRLDHCAERDSTAVTRFRAAGAVILGKTSTAEFLNNYETDNHLIGRTNNPWDLGRTAGGSSGGESAAIAAFCSAGGIGSDGGGSIRVPAHFCGIAGLKPTPGRVSVAGHFPPIAHPGGLLGVGGPMARTAADVRLLFQVLAGHDIEDPFSAPVPLRVPDLARIKVGVWLDMYDVPLDADSLTTIEKAAAALQQLGIPAEQFVPTGVDAAPDLWWFFFERLSAPFTHELMKGREQDAHWTGTELVCRALQQPLPTMRDVVVNLGARDEMRTKLFRQMERYPVLLTPVCATSAWPHRQRPFDLLKMVTPVSIFNLLGMPAIVIPFGMSRDGMPIGIQLVARAYEEELLLELAIRLEEIRGAFPAPEWLLN
jgi:Asp-tRNA(Asn)/Glu-tRNA(Gln) amidotransferase A subunit family amidase